MAALLVIAFAVLVFIGAHIRTTRALPWRCAALEAHVSRIQPCRPVAITASSVRLRACSFSMMRLT
ncbi:MAG TPA: hypothetical protein PLK10_03275, partial [Ottowia sp.]|nr:hypothetical protein [Ottowia sp.]